MLLISPFTTSSLASFTADCFLYYLRAKLIDKVFVLMTNFLTENHDGSASSDTHLFLYLTYSAGTTSTILFLLKAAAPLDSSNNRYPQHSSLIRAPFSFWLAAETGGRCGKALLSLEKPLLTTYTPFSSATLREVTFSVPSLQAFTCMTTLSVHRRFCVLITVIIS